MTESIVPADPHLLRRLRSAETSIVWRELRPGPSGTSARLAHLHDEECRVEERIDAAGRTTVTDAGPVGALVLLLAIDRSRELPLLRSVPAGADPAFIHGGISARWPRPERIPDSPLDVPISDLIGLARYALV